MNRKRRTKIFIDYANEEVKEFAKEVEENYEVEVIQEPKEGLAMIKVRETAKNTLFYLGEVLITETKVRINNQVGIGITKSYDFELSKSMAIADAAFELDLSILNKWIDIFEKCEEKGKALLNNNRNIVARTKVDFETMNV